MCFAKSVYATESYIRRKKKHEIIKNSYCCRYAVVLGQPTHEWSFSFIVVYSMLYNYYKKKHLPTIIYGFKCWSLGVASFRSASIDVRWRIAHCVKQVIIQCRGEREREKKSLGTVKLIKQN